MSKKHDFPIERILTLPSNSATAYGDLPHSGGDPWHAVSDPPQGALSSGGATAHALHSVWKRSGPEQSFNDWLGSRDCLVVHGGGQNRNLPAYACLGTPRVPLPVIGNAPGQRLDQTLLDLQSVHHRRLLDSINGAPRVLIASGDVLVRFGYPLPPIPDVDVLALGMTVSPDLAQHFGVLFVDRRHPAQLAFYLQKPTASTIRSLAPEHLSLVDTGVWLLSTRAVRVLMKKSGWIASTQSFAESQPAKYSFYNQFAPALGDSPSTQDPDIEELSTAVVSFSETAFHHFGSSRQLLEATADLLSQATAGSARFVVPGATSATNSVLLNGVFSKPGRTPDKPSVWIENSSIPDSWELSAEHLLTGIPENAWKVTLPAGACLDAVPVGESDCCLRVYGIDDTFTGKLSDPNTQWLNRPATEWFRERDIDPASCLGEPGADIHSIPLFPCLPLNAIEGEFVTWLINPPPAPRPDLRQRWIESPRHSAAQLLSLCNLERTDRQRRELRLAAIQALSTDKAEALLLQLDLSATVQAHEEAARALSALGEGHSKDRCSLAGIRRTLLSSLLLSRQDELQPELEKAAFASLKSLILEDAQQHRADPQCTIKPDQIVWGRSPVRLDLAGGWTDTPPYCLEHGGRVVNLAVNLNGQPPQQVFARISEKPEIVIRSIDLGLEQRFSTYEAVEDFAQPGSGFALAKAALALAGFVPRHHVRGGYASLKAQLEAFGGGIELSTVSAVPKGSGLGTSSLMAASLLATLSDLCGLGWDEIELFHQTLALEQSVTTGGGWQDQAGGIYRGVKLIETSAGIPQRPILKWLPDHLFAEEYANQVILLYYTGITRLAKGILQEVVRGVFLNSADHLRTLSDIAGNADQAFQSLLRADYAGLASVIRTSWELNQRLDEHTNPAPVQRILQQVDDYLLGAKLLGAGGGGYLLMLAKDVEAAHRMKSILRDNPPNDRARFVQFEVSSTGLQVTRS